MATDYHIAYKQTLHKELLCMFNNLSNGELVAATKLKPITVSLKTPHSYTILY